MSRKFSLLEQRIMKSLIELDSSKSLNFLKYMIEEFLDDYCYIEVGDPTEVGVQLKASLVNSVDSEKLLIRCSDLAVTLVKLFEYLESKGFIYFSGHYPQLELGKRYDEPYVPCDFINEDLKEAIYDSARQRIFLFETFKEFVENDFKSSEELQRNKELESTKLQLICTQVALGLSFIGLVASIIIPMITTSSISIKNDALQISFDSKGVEKSSIHIFESLNNNQDSKLNTLQQQVTEIEKELKKIKSTANTGNKI